MALKDNLIETCGNQLEAIARLQKWEHGDDSFSTAAYDFFRAHGSKVSWEKVVCESWSMTKFNFILWLVVLGKLKKRDHLQFYHKRLSMCALYSGSGES